jgi:hypothetical protein
MESELEKLRRANAELQAWVRDLLVENRTLRDRLALGEAPAFGGAIDEAGAACPPACA